MDVCQFTRADEGSFDAGYSIEDVVFAKVDLFMRKYVLPRFDPRNVRWLLSLSGGKDGFAMAEGIFSWYRKKGIELDAQGFYVNQWCENDSRRIERALKKQIPWLDIDILDGIELTKMHCFPKVGAPAPCRSCSLSRRNVGDVYAARKTDQGKTVLLSKGHHLTDVAISILWRHYLGADVSSYTEHLTKGNPLSRVTSFGKSFYVAKPLCYAREKETQLFADERRFLAVECSCPNDEYPSRRDVVRESLSLFFRGSFWEYEVPGMDRYLDLIGMSDLLRRRSFPGREMPRGLIRDDFVRSCVKELKGIAKNSCMVDLAGRGRLKRAAVKYILTGRKEVSGNWISPRTFYEKYSAVLRRMEATVGPFWDMFCLSDSEEELRTWVCRQKKIYNMSFDGEWSQTAKALASYRLSCFKSEQIGPRQV